MRVHTFTLILILLCTRALSHAQWQPNGTPVCDTSANSGFYMLPQIASDGNGGAFVCWRDARRGELDIFMQRIHPDGTMQFPHNGVPLCDASNSQQFSRMVSDGRGGAYVAWEDGREPGPFIYVQRIGASGAVLWVANGVKAADVAGLFISIALEPISGGVLLGWSTVADAFVQRLDSLGNRMWGDSGVQVTNRPGSVYPGDVSIISDGRKGAIVAWNEGTFTNGVIYVQRVDSLGQPRWLTNGIPLTDASSSLSGVACSPDMRGGAIVSWGNGSTGNVHVQRVDSNGTIRWTPGGMVLMNSAGGGAKRNTPDGFGGAYIGHGRWIQSIDSSGSQRWPGSGVAYTSLPSQFANSSQVNNENVGIWNFWYQESGTLLNVYGQYIDASGTRRWDSIGVLVSGGSQFQDFPRAASDGNGHAIVVWDDFRNGHSNVYAGKVDTSGVVTSISEGNELLLPATPTLEQNYPNPFNPETMISFTLPRRTFATLKVYDVLGRELETLLHDILAPGSHEVRFSGHAISSGVYFYRLTTEQTTLVKKMILVR